MKKRKDKILYYLNKAYSLITFCLNCQNEYRTFVIALETSGLNQPILIEISINSSRKKKNFFLKNRVY